MRIWNVLLSGIAILYGSATIVILILYAPELPSSYKVPVITVNVLYLVILATLLYTNLQELFQCCTMRNASYIPVIGFVCPFILIVFIMAAYSPDIEVSTLLASPLLILTVCHIFLTILLVLLLLIASMCYALYTYCCTEHSAGTESPDSRNALNEYKINIY